jgi:hypothetical protein
MVLALILTFTAFWVWRHSIFLVLVCSGSTKSVTPVGHHFLKGLSFFKGLAEISDHISVQFHLLCANAVLINYLLQPQRTLLTYVGT